MTGFARGRLLLGTVVLALLLAVVAVPALAKPPEGGPPGQAKDKADRPAENPVTLTGTIDAVTDENGKVRYTLTVDGTVYDLSAGPPWFWGDDHPLAPFVGESVTVDGEQAEGSDEVDVLAVNGTEVRAAGRPPWAGGWKAVGERHPGWSQAKADRLADRFGDCFPPGQCKDKPARGADSEADEPSAE
jgi:predicted heme/steroid binding protein